MWLKTFFIGVTMLGILWYMYMLMQEMVVDASESSLMRLMGMIGVVLLGVVEIVLVVLLVGGH